MHIFEDVERDIRRVYERWADRSADYFERSRMEYERYVRPAASFAERVTRQEMELINLTYTEWFLFEYELRDGLTPLECFVAQPPESAPTSCVNRLRQVAETQRFLRCAILEKSPEAGDVLLEDLGSGEAYLVQAPVAARRDSWRDGSLAIRIARVGGSWLHVGKTMLYDRAPPALVTPGPGEPDGSAVVIAKTDEGWGFVHREWSSSYFLNFLRDVIGIDGAYSESFRVVGGA